MTIEDPSLSVHGYQLLPLATSQEVGDKRKKDVSDIFWGVLFIVVVACDHWRSITECPWLPIVATTSNQLFGG